MSGFTFDYTPPPTLRKFMLDDSRVRAVRGPVGSAKSTAMVMEILRRATEVPQDKRDGIRRSKFVIVRNTLQQLKTTCLVTIQQLLRPIVRYAVSDQTIKIRMPGMESDWLFLPLDTPENVERLLSLELTGAWISEFREIHPQLVMDALSRCGRFPSRSTIAEEDKDFWYGLVMETNSFSEDSPWFEKLEEDLPSNWAYFVQPGAFEPNAENRENLPPHYYEDLMESNTPEWAEQYIHNRITPSLSGQAVFRNTFNTDFHVSDGELSPVPGYPLIIGVDTGRNPAATVCQMDHVGRLLVLAAIAVENSGMENFLGQHLTPLLHTARFAGHTAYLVLDPAGLQRSQIGEESVVDCCRRLGYSAVPAMTNKIDPRLRAVEKFLVEQRNGGPAILFDPVHAYELILAMQSRYRYKIRKDKTLEDKPEKKHPWSDYCFTAGTGVLTPSGVVPIEALKVGDVVVTPKGTRPVMAVGSRVVNEVVEVTLSDGAVVVCTPNHPFVMADGCVLEAGALKYGNVLESAKWQKTTSSGSTGGGTVGTRGTRTTGTSARATTGSNRLSQCTVTYGRLPTAPFQTGMWSITSTMTPATMSWPTWSVCSTLTTAGITGLLACPRTFLRLPELLRLSGTALKRVGHGIASLANVLGRALSLKSSGASSAANATRSCVEQESEGFAPPLASLRRGERLVSTTRVARALSAEGVSGVADTPKPRPVLRVAGVKHYRGVGERVYNLTVDVEHRYYIVGSEYAALVLNCDALQYSCLGTQVNLRGRMMARLGRQDKEKYRPEPTAGAWT